MNEQRRKMRIISYWPECLVLLICAVLLLGYVDAKEGYHMDELLSYELANAEFNPWIVPTQPQGRLAKYVENEIRGESLGETANNLLETVRDVVQNRGSSKLLSYKADVYEEPVWIENKTFTDYITVGEEDGFSYLSVYFNVKDDNHPPVHFMALHTVSSLFRGKATPIMGCVINLICVLGVMLLLIKLGRMFMTIRNLPEWGRFTGLLAAAVYGLSVGAVSSTLLIRMYAMVTFFCVALLYVHVRKLYSHILGGNDFTNHNKLLILITVLGFWTQYFFLFYCLVLAAVTAVVLWSSKRRQGLFCYVRAMVIAAVCGVVVYPFAIEDVFASGRGVEALENLSSGIAGYGERIVAFGRIVFEQTGWILLALPVIVAVSVWMFIKTGNERSLNQKGVNCILWIPPIVYFLLASRMSPYLVDRYIMPLFPFVVLAVCVALYRYVGEWSRREGKGFGAKVVAGVVALLFVLGQLVTGYMHESNYLYKGYAGQKQIAADYAEYPCVCVYQGVGYYENLQEFTRYDKTLLVTGDELANRKETESLTDLESMVVLIKGGLDRAEITGILEDKYGFYISEVLMEEGAPYQDTLLLVKQK